MNKINHIAWNFLILLFLWHTLGIFNTYLPDLLHQTILFISFVVFSVLITPDLDLKFRWLPLVKHRGATHNGTFIVVIAILLYFSISLLLNQNGYFTGDPLKPYGLYALLIATGFLGAWFLHSLADKMPFGSNNKLWNVILGGAVLYLILR